MHIVAKLKLLCFNDNYYLYSKGTNLYCSRTLDDKPQFLTKLLDKGAKALLSNVRLFARILRLEPRCGIFVSDHIAIVSFHGAIYRVDCKFGQVQIEHHYRPEMNNPLCFAEINGVEDFEDGVYYGEYFLNNKSAEVSIFKRNDKGIWAKVYTFPADTIYHIHGIVPNPQKGCVYILTGDDDSQSGIYECSADFTQVEPIVTGRQDYRSCCALPVADGLLYTTDTPLQDNYLYHIDFSTKELTPVMRIAGPSIYGTIISENEMLFSTSVEPDSNIKGFRYQLTARLGKGVKDRESHLYYVKADGKNITCQEIFKAKKDCLPMGLCQFGTMMFPAGKGLPMVTCQSLRKYDNTTILIDDFKGSRN